jgi:hypothetical protein
MWYGYVGPGIKGVSQDYRAIEKLKAVYPYLKFRKHYSEEQAWLFIGRQGKRQVLENIIKYGNIFNNHYVTVEYFITEDSIYYNILTKRLGYIKLVTDDENVHVENRTELIKVRLSDIYLNKEFISAHAIAIYHILKLLGSYVDVELKVPDHSIYYMLSSYTGNKSSLLRVLKYIDSRKGKIAITVKNNGG